MSLDMTTLLVVSSLVITVTSVLFITEAGARHPPQVDRLRSLALPAALTTRVSHLPPPTAPAPWGGNPPGPPPRLRFPPAR